MRRFTTPIVLLACVIGVAGASLARPIVPGYERLTRDAKASPAQRGRILLSELHCTACHAAAPAVAANLAPAAAPDLSSVGARITPQYLHDYLVSPHTVRVGATMPELKLTDRQVNALTHFLAARSGPIAPSTFAISRFHIEHGSKLYASLGCVACHAPTDANAKTAMPSIPLDHLARKTTVDALRQFLLNPFATRPLSRMPHMSLSSDEATALAYYLLREQADHPPADAPPVRMPGFAYDYYKVQLHSLKDFDFDKRQPDASGTLPELTHVVPKWPGRGSYALRLTGMIKIPRDGEYVFFLTSDDGATLTIDADPLVDNDGVHPPQMQKAKHHLTAGDHAISIRYFELGGGQELKLEWRGPGFNKQPLARDAVYNEQGAAMIPLGRAPFAIDGNLAVQGREVFASARCSSCHALPDMPVNSARPLGELSAAASSGCLTNPAAGPAPNFHLDDDQINALAAALRDKTPGEPSPAQRAVTLMTTLNCYACHERDGVGGPGEARRAMFATTQEVDLGDEGRIPPTLTGVGDKLKAEALHRILVNGELRVRPFMATRMPRFPAAAADPLIEALAAADIPDRVPSPPKFAVHAVQDGHKLVGITGLGCVNCHPVNGFKSLGIPAVDLGTVHQRLRYDWFIRFLADPPAFNKATRMPMFFVNNIVLFPDIAGGAYQGQADAIWTYLGLGDSMPIPAGMVPKDDELVPSGEPIVQRMIIDGVTPLGIAAGYPQQVNVAFDANTVRMARLWRGRFVDPSPLWAGRGGLGVKVLGTSPIDMPPGPAFALLDDPQMTWPGATLNDHAIGGRMLGYRFDKQHNPIFRYDLAGVHIEEMPIPVLREGGADLTRSFTLRADKAPENLYLMIAAGKNVQPLSDHAWRIDGRATVTLKPGPGAGEPMLRVAADSRQVIVPVEFDGGESHIEVNWSW